MVGLSVGVIEGGRITFLSGYGETLAGSGEKVTPQTVFRWASVSKGVAGTMVAKLAEQGKLNLFAPVAQYSASLKLPGGNENRATVADLLSHRLGLYRNAYDNKLEEGQDPAFLRSTLVELNSICAPGQCWSYQNVAYDASSEIVARLTGQSYAAAVKEQLFDPIGMTSASISRDGLVNSPSWARPHSVGRKPLEVLDIYYRVPAAGGVNSSIKDLALWMVAQAGGMPDVLSPGPASEQIHAPLVKTPSERSRLRKFLERLSDPEYGFGWRSYDYAGHRIVGHRGGVAGYRSLILFDPAAEKRGGGDVEQQCRPARRAGVRSDGHALSPAVPRLARARARTAAAGRAARSGGGYCRGRSNAAGGSRHAMPRRREKPSPSGTPRGLNFPNATGDGTARRAGGFSITQSGR